MLNLLARNWWLIEIRGVAAVAFGILAFLWPGLTLVVLVTLFAAYMLIDGIALLVSLRRAEPATTGHRLTVALMGILGVVDRDRHDLPAGNHGAGTAVPRRLLGDHPGPHPGRRGDPAAAGDQRRAVARDRRPGHGRVRRLPPRLPGCRPPLPGLAGRDLGDRLRDHEHGRGVAPAGRPPADPPVAGPDQLAGPAAARSLTAAMATASISCTRATLVTGSPAASSWSSTATPGSSSTREWSPGAR